MADAPSLEQMLAESQAQSQSSSGVTSPELSPQGPTSPAVTPGSAPSGVSSPDSLEGLLSSSEAESQKPLTATQDQGQGPVGNYAGGVNGRLADVLHSAYWMVKKATPIGMAENLARGKMPLGLDTEGELKERNAIKQTLHDQLGLNMAAEPDSTMGHMGSNTVDSMLSLGGFMAIAPKLAASAGYSTADYLNRTFGASLMKHPWLATVSDVVGGVPAQTVAHDTLPADTPAGWRMLAENAASVGGNIATTVTGTQKAVRGVGRLATALGKKAVEAADTIAQKFGSEVPEGIRNAAGITREAPIVSDEILDAHRAAESKVRAIGDTVVQAQEDWRKLSPTATLDEQVAAKRKIWALKQDENAAAAEAEAAWKQIPKEARGKYSQQAEAIASDFSDRVYPKVFAEEQLAGDRKLVDGMIDKALNQVRPSVDKSSEDFSVRISKGIDRSYQVAQKMEKKMWNRVDILDEKLPSRSGPLGDLDMYLNETNSKGFAQADIPFDAVQSLRQLFASQGKQAGIFQEIPSVRKLRGEITALDQMRTKELASEAPNYRRIANLTGLEALANKWITDAFPDNVPLMQARAFSSFKNDRFMKSEIFPFLSQGARGKDRIRPEDALNTLLTKRNAMDDVYRATNDLMSFPRVSKQADAYPTMLSPKQARPLDQLQTDIENGVRQSFQEEVANHRAVLSRVTGGQEADVSKLALETQRVVDKWTPRINNFSRAAGEMQTAMTEALQGVSDRRAIEGSALAKYFEANDASKAIDKIWSHPNAPQVVKAVISGEAGIGGFAKDPVALEGFRAAMVDKFLNSAGRGGLPDPQAARTLLNDPRINRTMTAALGPDRMGRLENIVDRTLAMQFDKTQSKSMQIAVWAGRWAAVKFAALVPNFGKGGQLQQAAIFSEVAKSKIKEIMGGGSNPVTVLSEAIRNPSVERLLYSQLPQAADKTYMNQANLLVRRVIRFNNAMMGTYEAIQGSDNDSPSPKPRTHSLSDYMPSMSANAAEIAKPSQPSGGDTPTSSPTVYDPFNNRTKDKMQGRVPPSIFPPPGKQASLQGFPSSQDDYREGARVISQDARRQRMQGPANNPFRGNSSPGIEIQPGNYYTPSDKGRGFPPNRVL